MDTWSHPCPAPSTPALWPALGCTCPWFSTQGGEEAINQREVSLPALRQPEAAPSAEEGARHPPTFLLSGSHPGQLLTSQSTAVISPLTEGPPSFSRQEQETPQLLGGGNAWPRSAGHDAHGRAYVDTRRRVRERCRGPTREAPQGRLRGTAVLAGLSVLHLSSPPPAGDTYRTAIYSIKWL